MGVALLLLLLDVATTLIVLPTLIGVVDAELDVRLDEGLIEEVNTELVEGLIVEVDAELVES